MPDSCEYNVMLPLAFKTAASMPDSCEYVILPLAFKTAASLLDSCEYNFILPLAFRRTCIVFKLHVNCGGVGRRTNSYI